MISVNGKKRPQTDLRGKQEEVIDICLLTLSIENNCFQHDMMSSKPSLSHYKASVESTETIILSCHIFSTFPMTLETIAEESYFWQMSFQERFKSCTNRQQTRKIPYSGQFFKLSFVRDDFWHY